MNIPDMVADLMDEEHLSDAQSTRFTKVYTSSCCLYDCILHMQVWTN